MSIDFAVKRRNRSCRILDMGLLHYAEAHSLQTKLVKLRLNDQIGDVLILLEHPAVLTLGRHRGAENILVSRAILKKERIEIYPTERGGNITYHGPGQLVGYPILNLKDYCQNISEYLRKIEKVIILTLKYFGVRAKQRPKYPGVWVGEKKIASIGIAIKQFKVTYHGFALNVNPNTSHFRFIHPCGIKGLEVTSLARLLGSSPEMTEVKQKVIRSFADTFEITIVGKAVDCSKDFLDKIKCC